MSHPETNNSRGETHCWVFGHLFSLISAYSAVSTLCWNQHELCSSWRCLLSYTLSLAPPPSTLAPLTGFLICRLLPSYLPFENSCQMLQVWDSLLPFPSPAWGWSLASKVPYASLSATGFGGSSDSLTRPEGKPS